MKTLWIAIAAIALSVSTGALAFHLSNDTNDELHADTSTPTSAPLLDCCAEEEGSGEVAGAEVVAATAALDDSLDCCDLEEAKASAVADSASPKSQVRIPDVWLTDQNGARHRLHSDLIEGKSVMIQFFFTSCTTVCPVLATVFRGVQDRAGDRLGDDLHLISISVDPVVDTPERLAAFAKHHGAKEGWTFLTGDPDDIRDVLTSFGVYTRKKEEHSSLAVIGHQPSGTWLYNSGFSSPDSLLGLLKQVESGKGRP